MVKHLLSLNDLSSKEIGELISLSESLKKNPKKCIDVLRCKSMLMMFSKPSLRTHLSFDIAMHQLGGHAIFYDLSHSVLGKKESIKDFARVVSRYVDVIMARLYKHEDLEELAKYAEVPVINGLTDRFHPCQALGDLMTIKEKLGSLKGKKLVFVGDCLNNVTHSLILGCNKVGMEVVVSCPNKKEFLPDRKVLGGASFAIEPKIKKAVEGADVVYTDSWMSYHIPKSKEKSRVRALRDYQVNEKVMEASRGAIFMHCLPATRGVEVTDGVMDSKNSAVYDQAENRLWSEKAVLMKFLEA